MAWAEDSSDNAGLVAVTDTQNFSVCHNEHDFSRSDYAEFASRQRSAGNPHSRLFQWCAQDPACASAYHLQGTAAEDEQVFRYLSSRWLHRQVDIMQPLNETVCDSHSFDSLLQATWLLEMRLQSHENARIECGANKRFMFSTETMEGHCVCVEDRNCEEGGNWRENSLNYSTVSTVIVAAVLTIVLLLHMCASYSRLVLYQRLTFHCQQKCGGAREKFQKNI